MEFKCDNLYFNQCKFLGNKLFFIKTCYNSCSACDISKTPTKENHFCITCANDYFKMSGTDNCYKEDEVEVY